jgi:hypothetical protein
MLHACVQRFDVTGNLKILAKFLASKRCHGDKGPVHPAYNPYFLACFLSRNSNFLSQKISQQCFSAGLSAQLNGSKVLLSFSQARHFV